MSEDIVTEAEARRLLGAAAATVEVDDPAPLTLTGLPEPRPHRRWSLLVAVAASVVLLASAAWVVARQLGDGQQAPPEPVQRSDGGIPVLVGATVAEARSALASAGYRAVVEEVPSCSDPAGLVRATEPNATQPLAAGGRVRLFVTADAGGDCPGPVTTGPVWDLVGEALGYVRMGGCADTACEEALPTLAELASGPDRLQIADGYDDGDLRCLEVGRAPAPGARRYLVHAGWQTGMLTGVCPRPPVIQVDVAGGRVVAVRVRGPLPDTADLAMLPSPAPPRRATALQFVRWARTGEDPPAFASRVRNLTPGFGVAWNDRPTDRSTWSGCSGLGFPDCGLDPVAAAYRSKGAVELATGIPPCSGSVGGQPEAFASKEGDVVRVSAPGFACDGWFVLLWIDGDGVIYGVM